MPVSFADLGLTPDLVRTVTDLGYTTPTDIQAEAIPHLLDGRDVLGQAQTGTGKTAAFALPLLQYLEPDGLQALILAPTRELAIQTAEAVHRYGKALGVRVLPVYGGQPYERQVRRIKNGVHIVVGTPGRTLDLIKRRVLKLHTVRTVVLDEADEMLKMGFIEDVEAILAATDRGARQTCLFSATLPKEIRRLAETYMRDPLHITVEAEEITVENTQQRYIMVQERDKVAALSRLLESEDLHNTLIFARTKAGAAELAETLIARGYPAEAIHGDLSQPERERILGRFRAGQLTILVATDVVARGVDIPEVSHVINFDIPQLGIEYVHRIGRTGRAGRAGDAITLVSPRQRHRLQQIQDYTHKAITQGALPSPQDILERRAQQFRDQIITQIDALNGSAEYDMVGQLMDMGYSAEQIAASAIHMLRAHEADRPLEHIATANERERTRRGDKRAERSADRSPARRNGHSKKGHSHETGMVRLYMDAGRKKGIRPGDVVYSVASAAEIPGNVIGAIDIRPYETFLDVPEAHVEAVLDAMQGGRIRGQAVTLVRADGVFEG